MVAIAIRQIPTVETVNQAYLTDVLRQAGFTDATVARFSKVCLAGQGYGGGDIWRFRLVYSQDTQRGGPPSIVLKIVRPSPLMRSDSGYVVREAHCYANGLFDQLTPVLSVPKAYHITVEPSQDECWIWLEDVGEHAFQRTWTLQTLEKAVRGIAHLHAQWWERTAELGRLSFLFPRGLALYQGHYTDQFKKVFAAMDSHREAAAISKVYTAERRDLLLQLQTIEDVVYPELDGLPQTLLHQDFIPPNVAFVDERMTLIDWAYAGPGTPGAELCVVSFLADMDLVLEDTIPNLDELLVETL